MMDLTLFIKEFWYIILILMACCVVLGYKLESFAKLPKDDKIKKIINWLVFACAKAESLYGSNTGKLKLRYVYDMFIKAFPEVAIVVTFETFSGWVDEALKQLNQYIETNADIATVIEDGKVAESESK